MDEAFMCKAMQQQFERMNIIFGEIQDRMEKQVAAIARLSRGQQHEGPNLFGNVANNEHVDNSRKESYNEDHDSTFNMGRLRRGGIV